ncbi:extracellular solute-binding protein [Arthrobacter dokdonensis]|uniref:extracellular solute-binding protein n=1 Tax=Arthrobacter dokdonellae TaxID=2211210 RepID=UPI000DE59F53|nr:extracellular solute-binding protein [Arthrobacter dokdonellae]
MPISRKIQWAATLALASLVVTGCGAPGSDAGAAKTLTSNDVPTKPPKAVTLNILDVAGNKQLTEGIFDSFVKEHPDVISNVTWETAGAPDMAGKVKAQQQAGNLKIDLVLTGTDGLAAGISQSLFTPVAADFKDRLSNMDNYQEPAAAMQKLAQDQAVELTYYPSGPLLEYNPAKVANPPTTAEELLAWAKANPGKFGYARPANSGPGRTFLMGLPYILGDKDPKDPVNGWDKTWNYLKELNQYIPSYPTGTGVTMNNLKNGTWDMAMTTTGWDINPRALNQVPSNFKVQAVKGFTWVTDAQYAAVPKGVSADKMSAILQVLQYALTPVQQAKTYDDGYFYPGPAVKDVTLSMAPKSSQDVIAKFGRPEYDALIADNPKATPIDADSLVKAFAKWDTDVANGKFVKK